MLTTVQQRFSKVSDILMSSSNDKVVRLLSNPWSVIQIATVALYGILPQSIILDLSQFAGSPAYGKLRR
jgi:hypothetical protein